MCFIKYHESEDMSSIIELSGCVGTLRSVRAYHEPAWHFDAKFVNGQGHEMANVQKATGHGHFLEMKNSVYHCPYDPASTKVKAIYIVYKIGKYDSTGTEHNYIFFRRMGDNHRGICFLEDEKTTVQLEFTSSTIWIFRISLSVTNPCRKNRWDVACVVYDTTSGKSSLWVNHGNICDFACLLPLKPSPLNLFNRVVHFNDASGFNGYIESVEMYNYII